MDFEDVAASFQQATDVMRRAKVKTTNDDKLLLYALFKQAECGQCNVAKPAFYDLIGRAKWEAWKKLGDMTREEAMKDYVATAEKLLPREKWTTEGQDSQEQVVGSSGIGRLSVSRMIDMNDEPTLRDDEKTAFDWCKEGNSLQLHKLLKLDPDLVKFTDDQGLSLLHWACDRGHVEVVRLLLEFKADVNQTDPEGQTPLHYGCCCDFKEVTQLLLSAQGDVNLRDYEGNLPVDVASSSAVKQLVSQGLSLY